jgi:hypothetical protein
MRPRSDKQILVRVAAPAHAFVEQLANESDRCVANMARRLLYERLSQIAAERGGHADSFTETAGGSDNSAATAAAA